MGLITKVASIMMLGGASSHQARAAGEGAAGRPRPTRPSPTGCCGGGPGARVAVDGLEYVSAVGPCVVVSSHRSGRSHYR